MVPAMPGQGDGRCGRGEAFFALTADPANPSDPADPVNAGATIDPDGDARLHPR